jgi:uncharacterized protein YcbK (DUF882 family)
LNCSHSKRGSASSELKIDRRHFLRLCGIAGITIMLPRPLFASVWHLPMQDRRLSLYNKYTGEQLNISYYAQGRYLPEALKQISYILRDHRTGEVKAIDPRLCDLLHTIYQKIQPNVPFQILSGYRSPSTNEVLRRRRRGVAKNSLHIHGKAVDLRLPGFRTSILRRTAAAMKGGGVGYYPRLGFVHLDVGEVRYWNA